MIRTHLKQALRNLKRNKIYSLINLTGLAVACAFLILTLLYVQNENSYDNFHKQGKNLYRLELTDLFNFDGSEPQKSFFSFLYFIFFWSINIHYKTLQLKNYQLCAFDVCPLTSYSHKTLTSTVLVLEFGDFIF